MKFKSAGFLVISVVLLLCLSGCTTVLPSEPSREMQTTPQPQVTMLPAAPQRTGPFGVTWYLVTYSANDTVKEVVPGTNITAFFNGFSTVMGSSGCNQYTASYSVSQNQLVINTPVSTMMSCESPPGIMTQEISYLATIQRAASYSVNGSTLAVSDSGNKVILTFTSTPLGPPVPLPLAGTAWYLESYVDSSGTTWNPARLTITPIMFTDDGKVYGNTGCNDYAGSYRVSGDQISISGLSKNRRYCGIAGVMELEATYYSMLPQMTRYTISGDILELSDPANGTSLRFDTRPNLP